ncbi:MAG: HU family DNA-binding protein [Acidobacteriota bacterium]
MTKAKLVSELSKRINIDKEESEIITNLFFRNITEALKNNERVELRGFGTFNIKRKKGRVARNPRTGEKVKVDSKTVVYFKPGKLLKKLFD